MPQRSYNREQVFLFPPSLGDWVSQSHPVRFVAEVLAGLDAPTRAALGLDRAAERRGASRYAPELLLGVWVYGFMSGVRSSRGLEVACRELIPFRWFTGSQTPDHNTLWRYYQAYRPGMQMLLLRTVAIAVESGLVDWAVQAIDGTKVAANAARDRTMKGPELAALLERTEAAIADLEAQQVETEDGGPPQLPPGMRDQVALRERVQRAAAAVAAKGGPKQANVTDPEARLMQTRQGLVPAYNAQAVVLPVTIGPEQPAGRVIVVAEVTTQVDDHGRLAGLIDAAARVTGQAAAVTVSDGGFHDGPTLRACDERQAVVVMPEAQQKRLKDPYHKQAFRYDEATDSYTCPQNQVLVLRGVGPGRRNEGKRVYGAQPGVCRVCSVQADCTTNQRDGRTLSVGPDELILRRHRIWMESAEAKRWKRRRGPLIEGVFGTLKERHRGKRFLLRGLANVTAEWNLLAATLNLQTLWRIWCHQTHPGQLVPSPG